jgi:hypothetical protein
VIKVVSVLEDVGLEYMLTGSMVSSLQGEPRATHDIDIVVTIRSESVSAFLHAFPPPDYYLSSESIAQAMATAGTFNLIDIKGGDKVDFWLLTSDSFDQSRFARRQKERLFGIEVHVSSPEDTILAKLKWTRISGGSMKHLTDAIRVYEIQARRLDIRYLEYWVRQLEVDELWRQLLVEARTI